MNEVKHSVNEIKLIQDNYVRESIEGITEQRMDKIS